MLLFALRFASLIYFVSAGANRCRPKAHDHREAASTLYGEWRWEPAIGVRRTKRRAA